MSATSSNLQAPLPVPVAAAAVSRCFARTMALLARGRVEVPRRNLGLPLAFGDGTSAVVYRETVVHPVAPLDPCVLMVKFRLRAVRGRGHRVFRRLSLLNTPLFVGFPGFVSKLWMAHDSNGVYRGIYEWDGSDQAQAYARALWRVLALVSVPASIRYHVVPGLRRDEVLDDPRLLGEAAVPEAESWWQLVEKG
ncbi:hypothetical protein [Actinoplanes solisilvae]|uniref:hypothetical protein n=1 Tax=Actinoplanes solisilvae TaxID=2486853 RepID=UPI000FDC5112|nr:hypothetical protein [Actinoplanes solisilvae]